MVAAALTPVMKAAGFRKRGMHWWIESKETFGFLNVQMSQFGPSFYLNLGVFLKGLKEDPPLNAHKCQVRYRVENLMPDRAAAHALFDFDRGGFEDDERLELVAAAVRDYALPFLHQCATLDGVRTAIRSKPEIGNYTSFDGMVFLGLKSPKS